MARLRVGLLGGSFNPAHDGHLHISRLALTRLRLDRVWWLVATQNPLKPVRGMASFEERLQAARRVADDRRIRVTDMELRLGTVYSVDTVTALRRRYPRIRFVWIMGADNLIQVPLWRGWQRLFDTVPIAVFARPSYCLRALAGKAARRFAKMRIAESRAVGVVVATPPAWVFLHTRLDASSATALRARRRSRAAPKLGRGR